MTQGIQRGWQQGLVDLIAQSVRFHRSRKEMSAQKLADTCANEVGFPVPRTVIANLENGRRDSISVAEWLALAAALDVPALELLFPLGRTESVEVLPGVHKSPWAALEWSEHGDLDNDGQDSVRLFRLHADHLFAWRRASREVEEAERLLAGGAPGPGVEPIDDPEEIQAHLKRWSPERDRHAEVLQTVRARIRAADLMPPRLPLGLRYIDDEEAGQ